MKYDYFQALNIKELSWECIKPVVMQIRGKNHSIKSNAYLQLNNGQKSLFSFHVYYNHAIKSPDDFYYWTNHFIELNFFNEIINGAKYFGDEPFLSLLQLVEKRMLSNKQNNKGPMDSVVQDEMFHKFKETSDIHITMMGNYIRKHPLDFLIFEEYTGT